MSIVYMGAFPPDYGGVTIKNQNLYTALEKEMPIKKVDFNSIKRKNYKEAIRLIYHLFNPKNRFVIGVSGKKTRKRFTQILYYFNRGAMKKSIIMVMGGTASHDMSVDPEYKKCAKKYKKIYVETDGMRTEMNAAGFDNVEIYPNGRFRPQRDIAIMHRGEKIKCVFFSLIQEKKGADLVLQAASRLPYIEFAFYGQIDEEFVQYFMEKVEKLQNVTYQGIFKGGSEEVYAELAQYDILLFPTEWDTEGVPGILVEGKIAGLAEIVSNKSYNAELVRDKIEGIVIEKNTGDEYAFAIQQLNENRELLNFLKKCSNESAERYYIENYISEIAGNFYN